MTDLPCVMWDPSRSASLSSCGTLVAYLLHSLWDLSSLTRAQTCIPCIARQILNHWATRKIPSIHLLGA